MRKRALVSLWIILFVSAGLVAEEATETSGLAIAVVGNNYCVGCTLKKTKGAAAQCSIYGHQHALKVERATGEDGSTLTELAGVTLFYLENDQSTSLIKGEGTHGEKVKITGSLFVDERILQVDEYAVLP